MSRARSRTESRAASCAGAVLLLATVAAAPAMVDAAAFARGTAAVGERPSDAIALRQARSPSASFRLGAAWRAWRNASAAITLDSSHPTGDGGDVEVLAEDCSDERIAFDAVEAARATLGVTPDAVAAAVPGIDRVALASWRARLTHPADHCRR